MQDRFHGKTWIYWAQLAVCGGLGLFSVIFGALFWTGAMTDANGAVRPEAGPPMVITGCCLLPVGVLAAFNIVSRIPPLIRCYREGIECSLVGATSLDGVPLVPGLVRVGWTILSLQGFRSQRLRILWPVFGGAQVGGIPMAYFLSLNGLFTNLKTKRITHGVVFTQVALEDHPERVADTLNQLAANPDRREQLSSWSPSPSREAAWHATLPDAAAEPPSPRRSLSDQGLSRQSEVRASPFPRRASVGSTEVTDEIVASFTWTERDYVAALRIWPLMQRSGCFSRMARTGSFLVLHLFVLFGPIVAYRFISGDHARDIRITPTDAGFSMLISLAALYVLYRNWYGVRRKLARAFRSSNLDKAKMTFKFDHQWIEVSGEGAQSRFAWSSVGRFVEFRDGFVIIQGSSVYWVPKSAFAEPSDEINLAQMAKARAGRFEFLDKSAAP